MLKIFYYFALERAYIRQNGKPTYEQISPDDTDKLTLADIYDPENAEKVVDFGTAHLKQRYGLTDEKAQVIATDWVDIRLQWFM